MSETLRHLRYVLGENPVTLAAFALFVLLVATALLGPWIAPYNPLATDAMHALAAPSAAHWCGTDAVGRDILSRIIAATRLDLGIAFAAVALSFAIGALGGLAAGYFGGWTERAVAVSPTLSWLFRCSSSPWASSRRSAILSPTSSTPPRSSTCRFTRASPEPRLAYCVRLGSSRQPGSAAMARCASCWRRCCPIRCRCWQ